MKDRKIDIETLDQATVVRVASEVVTEIALEFQMCLFAAIEKGLPDFAAELKPDYEAWIALESSMQKKTSGNFNFDDMARRLPNNKWWQFLKEMRGRISPPRPQTKEGMED